MLKELSKAQLETLYLNDVYRDFPESEIKPWEVVSGLYDRGFYIPLGYFDGGVLTAYVLLIALKEKRTVLLDYFAVLPEHRNSGAGSDILKELRKFCATFADNILIESEYPETAPDRGIAERRLGFYRRAGAELTDTQVFLFGVHFLIFTLSCGIVPCDAAGDIESIYRVSVPPEQYDSVVEIFTEAYALS